MGSPPRAYCTARRRRLRTGARAATDSDTLLATVNQWERLRAFISHGVWALDLDQLSPRARLGVRLLRFVVVVAWDYQRSALGLRSGALVYSTLLSIVPLLAVAFSVLKAFGVHHQLAQIGRASCRERV